MARAGGPPGSVAFGRPARLSDDAPVEASWAWLTRPTGGRRLRESLAVRVRPTKQAPLPRGPHDKPRGRHIGLRVVDAGTHQLGRLDPVAPPCLQRSRRCPSSLGLDELRVRRPRIRSPRLASRCIRRASQGRQYQRFGCAWEFRPGRCRKGQAAESAPLRWTCSQECACRAERFAHGCSRQAGRLQAPAARGVEQERCVAAPQWPVGAPSARVSGSRPP